MNPMETALKKAVRHLRLDGEEALFLLENADLLTLADIAHRHRLVLHPRPLVTYVVDRNINYTNVCTSGCKFCAYFRRETDPDAFVISTSELDDKIRETIELGGTQILLQGGMHPGLGLDYYLDLLRHIKQNFSIHIHGFSPTEIASISEDAGISVEESISRLMSAGLDSIPGGGAEILVDEIRRKISPRKCDSDTWLGVMRSAYNLGLKTTATMMFGHLESTRDIISHLLKIRSLQDDTGGFTAFIPWTFQPDNTGISVERATASDYLRILAVSRIVLDNVPNLQASWVTQGDKIAQLSLSFGANDLGSTMIEENVVAAAGVRFRLPEPEMVRLIETAGYRAVRRDCFYNHLEAR
jgi:cyclic dehypoxanthinyl futalosine synthase